jgi:hypothetical protein
MGAGEIPSYYLNIQNDENGSKKLNVANPKPIIIFSKNQMKDFSIFTYIDFEMELLIYSYIILKEGGEIMKNNIALFILIFIIMYGVNAQQSPNTFIVYGDSGKSTIDKNIYGHFTEHLGRCIYGGIWVG